MDSKKNFLIAFLLCTICFLIIAICYFQFLHKNVIPSKITNSNPVNKPDIIKKVINPLADTTIRQQRHTTNYYIDNIQGDNKNPGTSINKSWKDFSNLKNTSFAPGDKILLKRGEVWNQTLFPPGGNKSSPIIIDAYGNGALPIIDVKNSRSAAIRVYHSYISINNLQLQNSTNDCIAIGVSGGFKNIKLKNIMVFNAGNNGIGVSGGGTKLEISGCYIENAHNNGIYLGGSAENKLSNVLISDCHITKILSNDGITIHEDRDGNTAGTNFILKNNTCEMCAEQGFDITAGENVLLLNNNSNMNKQGGIVVGHSARNVTINGHISSNEPTENTSAAINLGGKFGNIRLLKSIIKGNGYHLLSIRTNNVAVYNNDFIWDGGGAPIDVSGKIENINFINNIIYSKQNKMSRIRFLQASRPPDYKSFHFDYNLYYAPDNHVIFYFNKKNYNFKAYKQKFKIESHSRNIDPKFINPLEDKYQLDKKSPAIDTGCFYTHPVLQGTGNKLLIKNALFFYKCRNPEYYQCIMFEGIKKIFKIIDVNYKNNTIVINQSINYVPKNKIGVCYKQFSLDIGKYESENTE